MFARHVRRYAAAATALAIVAAPGMASATEAAPSATHTIDITTTNYAFDLHLHGPVAAGLVRVNLTNAGVEDHEAQLLRLQDGVTVDAFTAALQAGGDGAALSLTEAVGGPGPVPSGGHQTTWQVLRAGVYVAVCLIPGPDGMSHLSMGMLAPFEVRGALPRDDDNQRPTDHIAGTITAHDMTFTLPQHFTGKGIYRFTDTDAKDTHEVALLKLAPGKHAADVTNWLMNPGPPPFTTSGGFAGIAPQGSGYVKLALEPGTYVAACFVADDQAPYAPHAAMGMVVEFTVR